MVMKNSLLNRWHVVHQEVALFTGTWGVRHVSACPWQNRERRKWITTWGVQWGGQCSVNSTSTCCATILLMIDTLKESTAAEAKIYEAQKWNEKQRRRTRWLTNWMICQRRLAFGTFYNFVSRISFLFKNVRKRGDRWKRRPSSAALVRLCATSARKEQNGKTGE